MNSSHLIALVALLLSCGTAVAEQSDDLANRPMLVIKPQVEVSKDTLFLGDIATITARDSAQEQLVQKLKEISLGAAPGPRGSLTLLGASLLDRIESHGVSRDAIGYSVPGVVTVSRGGREITKEEVLAAIRTLASSNKTEDLRVNEVSWSNSYSIPKGETRLEIQRMGEPQHGKLPVRVEAFVNNLSEARFLATATVDYWREVPVLSRNVERGMLINPSDIQIVRVNINQEGADIVSSAHEAVGQKAKSRIAAGSVIRRSLIDFPPTILRGSRIAITYRSGGLSAQASGVAIQDGQIGEIITVQNESSKKQIRGKVIDSESVEVNAQ